MARINSMGVGKARGSMGNVTYRTVKGQTIGSQKIDKGTQLIGTLSQVMRRVRMANLVFAYRQINAAGNGAGMYQAFPHRPARSSNWNEFFRKNINSEAGQVSLTKEEASRGFMVCAPLLISEGNISVPELQSGTGPINADGGYQPQLMPDNTVSLGAATAGMGATTDVGTLSQALIQRWGLMDGDVVTIYGVNMAQATSYNGFRSKVNVVQFVLDSTDDENLAVDLGLQVITVSSNTYLGVTMLGEAAAVVIGRNMGSSYEVSTSRFVLNSNGNAEFIAHSGNAAKSLAASSYGYKMDPYLQDGTPQ